MKNMPVVDPDLELREGSTWFFVASALPAFLPSTILFSFTQNKAGAGAPQAPSLDSPLYAYWFWGMKGERYSQHPCVLFLELTDYQL